MNSTAYLVALLLYLLLIGPVIAAQVEDLDPTREWRVRAIEIAGNQRFSSRELRAEMLTQTRPWFRFWQHHPEFDPVTFQTDLERLQRFYETNGYYNARITYELIPDEAQGLMAVRIRIAEDQPVVVTDMRIDIPPAPPGLAYPPLPKKLPIARGEVFKEDPYQATEQVIRGLFMESGFAHTETERRAEVYPDDYEARVWYFAQPGPLSAFGETEVRGTRRVEPYLITRELTYEPGELFSLRRIRESRQRLLGLDLFSALQIHPQKTEGHPSIVPMEVIVTERPPREISLGVGYNTEEEFRVSVDWRHRNWLGGGRRLTASGVYSNIVATGLLELVQPHFLTRNTQGALALRYDQEREDTYVRNAARFAGRIQHNFSPNLVGSAGYRVEYSHLTSIAAATVQALGDIRREGILSGPSIGLVWNTTDDLLYPTRGEVLSFTAEQIGVLWGGDYRFFRLLGDARKYFNLGWETILATRLRLGLADAIGADQNFPLFERFYSGGQASVRGYQRRRLGPLSAANDPLGGLSLIEGSVELRRPIWDALGGAVFVDFGQVSLRSFDIPVSNLRFSTGFGVSYTTPVGPLRLDIGFPLRPPSGEQRWQIHFSIGAFF